MQCHLKRLTIYLILLLVLFDGFLEPPLVTGASLEKMAYKLLKKAWKKKYKYKVLKVFAFPFPILVNKKSTPQVVEKKEMKYVEHHHHHHYHHMIDTGGIEAPPSPGYDMPPTLDNYSNDAVYANI